jgi:hypothetical protein
MRRNFHQFESATPLNAVEHSREGMAVLAQTIIQKNL